jgi:ubiquinone/menaquinone biosynthesis C-methylase UbiE
MKNNYDYWKSYWSKIENVSDHNPQKNIGRTNNGIPIKNKVWLKTVNEIKQIVSISESSNIIELCSGNGQLIGNLAPYCNRAVAVDYSIALLEQLKNQFLDSVDSIHADALTVQFEKESYDIVIIYFAIQHFEEKDTVRLIQRSLEWLRYGGRIYIGDIPDEDRKWKYISKEEYKKDYFIRLINDEPKIGKWFQQDFFKALESYIDGITVRIIKQPTFQINSTYRFDVLIEKIIV